MAKARKVLRFQLAGPASPERVARAAQALADILKATAGDLEDGAVTLVVENYATRGKLRAWTPESERAAKTAIKFLEDPAKAAAKVPRGVAIARELRRPLRELAKERAVILRPRSPKPIREVTDEFVARVTKAGDPKAAAPTVPVYGEDVVVSRILRVGRKDAISPIQARMTAGGALFDIAVPSHLATKFYDAAKAEEPRTVAIRVTWKPDEDGKMLPDMSDAEALSISDEDAGRAPWGALLAEFHEAHPDAFEDVDDVLGDMDD